MEVCYEDFIAQCMATALLGKGMRCGRKQRSYM